MNWFIWTWIVNVRLGDEQARLEDLGGAFADVLVSTLDNRNRKVFTGDSSGRITVYNCLTGAKLKQFPLAPSAVRFLVYSPDKTVIAVGGAGDIFIYDDSSNDELPSDALLRECRAHDVCYCFDSFKSVLICFLGGYNIDCLQSSAGSHCYS